MKDVHRKHRHEIYKDPFRGENRSSMKPRITSDSQHPSRLGFYFITLMCFQSCAKTINNTSQATRVDVNPATIKFVLPANVNAIRILSSQLHFRCKYFAGVENSSTRVKYLLRICDLKISGSMDQDYKKGLKLRGE